MMTASNIYYEISDRTRAISTGGIGAIHLLAQRLGLVRDINDVHLDKAAALCRRAGFRKISYRVIDEKATWPSTCV